MMRKTTTMKQYASNLRNRQSPVDNKNIWMITKTQCFYLFYAALNAMYYDASKYVM
jgi:hypothetical protein